MIADSAANILAQYLVDQGIVSRMSLNLPWPISVSSMPDSYDNAVSAYDCQAKKDGRFMKGGQTVFHFGVDLTIRGQDYPTGWTKGVEIQNAFDSLQRVRVQLFGGPSYLIQAVTTLTALFHIGQEKNKRERFNIRSLVAIGGN